MDVRRTWSGPPLRSNPSATLALSPMTEESFATLLDQAARARRFAIALDGDRAVQELERYAEELEAEIQRRTTEEPLE
jgi:hypothetical protein